MAGWRHRACNATDVTLEKEFGKLERWLGLLMNAWMTGDGFVARQSIPKNDEHVRGLISLEYRSRHQLAAIKEEIERSERSRRQVNGGDRSKSVAELVHENLERLVGAALQKLQPLEISVFHVRRRKGLVLSDQPAFSFIDPDTLEEHGRIAVLTDRMYVIFRRGEPGVAHAEAPDDFVDSLNQQSVVRAREWIVAPDEQSLDGCIEYRKPQGAQQDNVVLIPQMSFVIVQDFNVIEVTVTDHPDQTVVVIDAPLGLQPTILTRLQITKMMVESLRKLGITRAPRLRVPSHWNSATSL